MPFQPWLCNACKTHGKARHAKDADGPVVLRAIAERHAQKSPVCALKTGHKYVDILITPALLKT